MPLDSEKTVYIVGKYPHSRTRKATYTHLLQARALGYLKIEGRRIPVIGVYETRQGVQIEIDLG